MQLFNLKHGVHEFGTKICVKTLEKSLNCIVKSNCTKYGRWGEGHHAFSRLLRLTLRYRFIHIYGKKDFVQKSGGMNAFTYEA